MVSTRQMSTTISGHGVPGEDTCSKISTSSRGTNNSLSTISNSSRQLLAPSGSSVKVPNEENIGQKQKINLIDLPMEILDKMFSYVGYKKVGQMRLVSREMNQVCSTILNSTFSKLQTQMLNRFQTVKAKMPRRESARRNHPLACECDIIETCHMRLSLLQMTFGKHIERKHCCFFAGGILDEVYNIINYVRNTQRLERPFKVTDELFDLSTMAMEYFKENIEPNLPEIAYFANSKQSYSSKVKSELKDDSCSMPSPPQSNMVLRKGIRKIKQGMKMYNNQLTVLRNELRTCKRKSSEQGKQIAEQQKLLGEQQKQTLEYANRLDENDKKNEEMSRKFSTLLQELNKCKTELQYWRSKSPATQTCTYCGQKVALVTTEDFKTLINQGVEPEDININLDDSATINTIISDKQWVDTQKNSELVDSNDPSLHKQILKSPSTNVNVLCTGNILKRKHEENCNSSNIFSNDNITNNAHINVNNINDNEIVKASSVEDVGIIDSIRSGNNNIFLSPSTSFCTSKDIASSNISSDTKKARRVQNYKNNKCHKLEGNLNNVLIKNKTNKQKKNKEEKKNQILFHN